MIEAVPVGTGVVLALLPDEEPPQARARAKVPRAGIASSEVERRREGRMDSSRGIGVEAPGRGKQIQPLTPAPRKGLIGEFGRSPLLNINGLEALAHPWTQAHIVNDDLIIIY
jgi:hypothetical protein